MTQTIYRPPFRKQLTGVATQRNDCGPIAVQHAVLRYSLGALAPAVSAIRAKAGVPTAQFTINDVTKALAGFGITVAATWDRFDDFHVDELEAWLAAGNYAVLLGDYDEVPASLKGDREFMQNHFTFANESVAPAGDLMYDSLDDGRIDAPSTTRRAPLGPIVWPDSVVNAYLHGLSDQQDEDVTVSLIRRRTLGRKATTVNVRAGPSRTTAVIGSWVRGPVEYGGVVIGESIAGNSRWFRIWWPLTAQIAFVHSSVVIVSS
jgi:hypothetical protein